MITDIIYRGGGFTITTDDGKVHEGVIVYENGVATISGLPENIMAELLQIQVSPVIGHVLGGGDPSPNSVTSGSIAPDQIGTIHISSGGLGSGAIGSGQIGAIHLASGVLSTPAIYSGSIVSGQIGNGTIVSGSIASGQIGGAHLASGIINLASGAGQIYSGQIASGQVGDTHLASGILNLTSGVGLISANQIASGQINSGQFASGTILPNQVTSGGIVSGMIGNNAVVSGSIASGQIGQYHLANGSCMGNLGGTGLQKGGIITINGDDTKFDIAAGSGFVVDNHTDPANPVITHVKWNAFTAVTDSYLATNNQTQIAIDKNGNIVQQGGDPFTTEQLRDYIFLGKTVHPNRTNIIRITMAPRVIYNSALDTDDIAQALGIINVDGNVFSPNDSNLFIDKSSGTMYRVGGAYLSGYKNPNFITNGALTALSFFYRYRNGSGDYTTSALTSSIDPNKYDDGSGTPQSVPSNRYTIQRIYYFSTGSVYVTYGQAYYQSLADALDAISTEAPDIDPNFTTDAALRCFLVVKEGVTALNNPDYTVFVNTGKLGEAVTFGASYVLNSGGVTSGIIGNAAVVSGSIASGQVGQYHLASGTLSSFELSSGVVQSGHIGNNAVISGNVASGQIGQYHLASGILGFPTLTSGCIQSGHIGDNAVTSGNIASGQIGQYHLASGTIQVSSGGITSGMIGDVVDVSLFSGWLASGTISGLTSLQQVLKVIDGIGQIASEPMGFPNVTDTSIAWDDTNKIFTLAPTATSFKVWVKGREYKFTTSVSKDISGVIAEGAWFFYFDYTGTMQASQIVWDLAEHAPIALVYWDSTNSKAIIFSDERHGLSMDHVTHRYLHLTRGTAYRTGLGVTGTITGTGGADADAQVAVGDGTIFDEDIQIDITDGLTSGRFIQSLSLPAQIPVYYRSGVGGLWRKKTANNFPLYENAGNRISYNLNTAGTWTVPPSTTNGNYIATWLFATDNFREPVIAILGQREDTTLANAQVNNVYSSLDLTTLPAAEMKIIARIIFQTSTTYGNTPKARTRDLQDLRNTTGLPGGSFTSTDHNSLTGRSNFPAHPTTAIQVNTSGLVNIVSGVFLSGNLQEFILAVDSQIVRSGGIYSGQILSGGIASGQISQFHLSSGAISRMADVPAYANNAAALGGGLLSGQIYRTGGDPDTLCIVH